MLRTESIEPPDGATESYRRLVTRLSTASEGRRTNIFNDIPWEAPECQLELGDPRWRLSEWDTLAPTEWYADQTLETRSELALARSAWFMKVGIEFEAGLQTGLLGLASTLPNGDPTFRYAYHEIIEEAQHSLMFQEYINRSPFDPPALDDATRRAYAGVAKLGRTAPELFFLCVLSGEEPIDYLQRRQMDERTTHPLVLAINSIHCAEEARHLSFARSFLRYRVPLMEPRALRELQYQAPLVIRWAALRMFEVPEWMNERWEIPTGITDSAMAADAKRDLLTRSTSRITALCRELGILTDRLERLWRRAGLV